MAWYGDTLVLLRQYVAVRDTAAQRSRFRSLVQRSSDLITVVDREGIVRYQSPSLEALLAPGGRLVEQRLPEASGSVGTRRIEYDDANNRRTTTDELGRVMVEQFDSMGRLLSVTEAVGTLEQRSRSLDYDDHGNVTVETDWLGRITEIIYDELDRVSVRNAPEHRSTTLTYDALGHVLTETVASREVGSSEVPRLSEFFYRHPLYLRTHERRQLIDDSGSRWLETIHEYDENGNLRSTTDPRGHVISQTYDDRDRLIERDEPEGRSTVIDYDDADRRISETLHDRDGGAGAGGFGQPSLGFVSTDFETLTGRSPTSVRELLESTL